jgi:opacity protein-like surface antigen
MTSPALPEPPHNNRRTAPSILFAVVAGFAATVGGTATANAVVRPQTPPKYDETIRYEVSGAPGTVEYLTYEIDYAQAHETNVRLPWSKQFSTDPAGHTLLLSAQGTGSGTLTCRILVDGKLVSQATASGQPARTECSPSNQAR